MTGDNGVGDGPLSGMLVIDLAHGLAGPFTSTLLADFGADVIKVERPGNGDFMRQVDPAGGVWWRSMARGKRSIAVDLANPESRALMKDLVTKADALVESYRPGVLERLGYGPDVLREWNPELVLLRTSGYGQTGPYRERPGFGKAAEAFAGLLHMTGFPDGPPVYVGFAIADMCSGLMGAFGVALAWMGRTRGLSRGQTVDVALYETILRLMDYVVPVASGSSIELERNGNRQPMSFAPSGIVRSKDDRWIVYSAASAEVARRVVELVAGPEVAAEARFSTLETMRDHLDEIDALVGAWCHERGAAEIVEEFTGANAVAALVYSPDEILTDPHVKERNSVVPVEGENAQFVAVTPKLSDTPGRIRWSGPNEVGQDSLFVLSEVMGYDNDRIDRLRKSGAVVFAEDGAGPAPGPDVQNG